MGSFVSQILLMEEIRLTTWDITNVANNGTNYQPQLVSRILPPTVWWLFFSEFVKTHWRNPSHPCIVYLPTFIYHKNQLNVGKNMYINMIYIYNIHGWYGQHKGYQPWKSPIFEAPLEAFRFVPLQTRSTLRRLLYKDGIIREHFGAEECHPLMTVANPPTLLTSSETYIAICGFKRVLNARNMSQTMKDILLAVSSHLVNGL